MTLLRLNAPLLSGVLTAMLALLVAFGVTLTQEQTAAILGVSAAILGALAQWVKPPPPPTEVFEPSSGHVLTVERTGAPAHSGVAAVVVASTPPPPAPTPIETGQAP